MAKLDSEQRRKLDDDQFAASGRRYPIHDRSHAANALARASQHAPPKERAAIRKKVCGKYGNMPSCNPHYQDPLG